MKERFINAAVTALIATVITTLVTLLIPVSQYTPDVGPFAVVPAKYEIYGYPQTFKITTAQLGEEYPYQGADRPFAASQVDEISFFKLTTNISIYYLSFFILFVAIISFQEKRKK